jgi:hypothetical protein
VKYSNCESNKKKEINQCYFGPEFQIFFEMVGSADSSENVNTTGVPKLLPK